MLDPRPGPYYRGYCDGHTLTVGNADSTSTTLNLCGVVTITAAVILQTLSWQRFGQQATAIPLDHACMPRPSGGGLGQGEVNVTWGWRGQEPKGRSQ